MEQTELEYLHEKAEARAAYLDDKFNRDYEERKIEEAQSEMTFTNGIADYLPF